MASSLIAPVGHLTLSPDEVDRRSVTPVPLQDQVIDLTDLDDAVSISAVSQPIVPPVGLGMCCEYPICDLLSLMRASVIFAGHPALVSLLEDDHQ